MAKSKKAGRKPLPGGREKVTTTLPRGYLARLRKIGNGNASQAIIMLVDNHEAKAAEREGWTREQMARAD